MLKLVMGGAGAACSLTLLVLHDIHGASLCIGMLLSFVLGRLPSHNTKKKLNRIP